MEIKDAVTKFAGLGQETRLRIFRMLIQEGPTGLPAGTLAQRLQVPAPTLSAHLSRMERAGLLRATRQQRQICYAVEAQGIRDLLAYLVMDCCQGRPDLCGFPSDESLPPSSSGAS